MKPSFHVDGKDFDMEQTFYIRMKICDYYTVYINDDGYERKRNGSRK